MTCGNPVKSFPLSLRRAIVTRRWTNEAAIAAKEVGVELWDFRDILRKIADECSDPTCFFDDTLRTVLLFQRAAT